jgi:hypothetical protein
MTVRSKSGQTGIVREEVWVNSKNEVVKYNLAYINFRICQADNGRVLGYDNAHGHHERHSMGAAEATTFSTYADKSARFYAEIKKMREES